MTDWRIMDLGNTPLSFEVARNVLTSPDNATKIFTETPYINPSGGKAYIFQSPMPLCKLHAKFDPYKFMYLGKGFNKEFSVMKRYYHLKHKRTDLNKQLYNFQRHIYCVANDETDTTSSSLYLVHYFGNDYLLEDAIYRKGMPPVTGISDFSGAPPAIAYDESLNATVSDDEESLPSMIGRSKVETVEKPTPSQEYIPASPLIVSARKRKSSTSEPFPSRKPPEKKIMVAMDPGKSPSPELSTVDYLFAMNMAARLQQLPDEIKARVKFQIATVFYEAEMKALNCPVNDY